MPAGKIFGFLGPNGAGKRPRSAACSASSPLRRGETSPAGLPHVADRIGAVVDRPALFDGFSGRRNLQLLAGLEGLPRSRVDAALERVGLATRSASRLGSYFIGMRQRLAPVAVLMKDPELLILDEPANGLDPAGFREVRDLLRSLAGEGHTVFLSSHHLGEVEHRLHRSRLEGDSRCAG